ncbi:hypothetical protein Aperf_G00000093479 [Anoplocephala perfoliata]
MEDYNSEEPASGDPCFYYEIPGGLLDKDVIEITGFFYGEKIIIEVLAEKYNRDGENTALPLQFTLTRAGEWTAMTYTQSVSAQTQTGSTAGSDNFQIRIVALDSGFEIFLNGTQLCTQKHLVPLPQVSHISIDGDAEFTGVEFKDLVSENDTSARSDHLSGTNEYDADAQLAPGFTRLSENRRSSNRKPKPPVVVPTHGSFRAKPSLATTREESDNYVNAGEDLNPMIKVAPAPQTVKSSADPTVDTTVSGIASSGKLGSNLSLSGKKNPEKKLSLREKFQSKKSSKGSVNAASIGGHERVNAGSAEDVSFGEGGGPEFSADGADGVFHVTGAASVPNLSSHPDKGKEKKRFTLSKGNKKSRSTSSPPGGLKADEEEKKKHFLGLHFGKGGKKEKEPKPEKKSKVSVGRKSSKPGSAKAIPAVGSGAAGAEYITTNDVFDIPDPHLETGKVTLASMAKQSKIAPSASLHNSSLMGSHAKGSYNLDSAEKTLNIQQGKYQRTSADGGISLSGGINGSTAAGIGGVGISIDDGHNKKLKGESANIAAQLMDGPAVNRGSTEFLTNYDPSLEIPLHLESSGDKGAVGIAAGSFKEENKKEKRSKLKGASAEIADDLLGNNRGMSSEFVTYTGTHITEPLRLTSDDLLSVGGKSFTPILGSKGSYNLETVPDIPTGTYQPRADVSWVEEPAVVQKSAVDIQHSKAPGVEMGGGAVSITSAQGLSKKEKKNLLKGESAEIASNLFDEEGVKVLRKASTTGYPLCGANGFNMPWKIDAANKDAQPIPYGIMSSSYSSRLKDRNNFGDEYVIAASSENDLHAAAPLSGGTNLYETKSATVPRSAEHGTGGASAAIAMRDKDKKGKKDHEGDDKEHKHHRISGIFGKMFRRRKRKSGTSQSEGGRAMSEEIGTDYEMLEYRTSSQQSFDFDGDEADFTVTAKPSEVCLFASQLRGNKPALEFNSRMRTMCGGGTFQIPLRLTKVEVPADISAEGAKYVFASSPLHRQRTDSLLSWSTMSPGGSRRIYHQSSRHRPESASSWSSISPSGTRRHRTRAGSLDTRRSVTPGGSYRIYHLSTKHRPESASSWSSVSPGGTRKHRRRTDSRRGDTSLDSIQMQQQIPAYAANEWEQSTKNQPESLSSWPSVPLGGTSKPRERTDSMSSWSSTTPGKSRHYYHRSDRHRPESVSSWSSISPQGTRRHRRRGDISLDSIQMKQQIPAYAANERKQSYDSYFNIQKQESAEVHASYPQTQSAHSSNSSIASLYGRVVMVGQSEGFRTRIQSYRKRMEKLKKSKRSSGQNGYNSGSNSSISSIASDRLPPTVVKARGGEYAIFVDGGETIFQERPSKKEDVYAYNANFYGSTR